MRDFEYAAPTTLAEAVKVFAEAKGKARALAGGTDLIDQIRVGRRTPEIVVDLKRIPELNVLTYDQKSGLCVGAAVPLTRVASDANVKRLYPGVAASAGMVGSVQVQNRAALGGNIGNAAPSADTVPCLIALNARVTIAGPRGNRQEPLEKIFAGPGQLTLQQDEFLVDVCVPPPAPRSTSHYVRFTPRAEMDIAVAGVGVNLVLADGAQVQEVGIVLSAVAPRPVRATAAEGTLRGQRLTADLVRRAGEQAVQAASPITDVRGSAEYRRELVKVLTRRALTSAAETLGTRLN